MFDHMVCVLTISNKGVNAVAEETTVSGKGIKIKTKLFFYSFEDWHMGSVVLGSILVDVVVSVVSVMFIGVLCLCYCGEINVEGMSDANVVLM